MNTPKPSAASGWPVGWLLLVFGVVATYLFGLGSPYAPTNGDEMVYIHIARLTALSDHWLPLVSELENMRNTKPPLLIWQSMVAGDWGQHWSLAALRLPSVLYTLLTTVLLGWFARVISGSLRTALLSCALYLLFFSTFRYGRVYLTSAPETFWFSLPLWHILWLQLRPSRDNDHGFAEPRWWHYTCYGLALGLGSAYKSFALLAPACATAWCALLVCKPPRSWRDAIPATLGLAWSAVLALAIFALWFVLDPDPMAVWNEFVVGENAGKMTQGPSYWRAAIAGDYPAWMQLLAYPENAGVLLFVVLGFFALAIPKIRQRSVWRGLSPAWRVMLVWLVVWLVVFTIPSQRSARYVIPAMPALAILMALAWERIARPWFWLTLVLATPALLILARVAWVLGEMGAASTVQVALVLIAASAGLASVLAGFVFNQWTRNAALVTCATVYAAFGLMVEPLSQRDAGYSDLVRRSLAGHTVAVPNGFNGQYERFHFVLPGGRIEPYDAEGRDTGAHRTDLAPGERLTYLLEHFDAVVWIQDQADRAQPSCAPQCRVLGQRWHVKSRHKSGEVTLANVWYPQEWLFRREWLLTQKVLPPSGN